MSDDMPQYLQGNAVFVHSHAILITGSAGVGKSRLTLQLIEKGHALIADDMVHVTCSGKKVFLNSLELAGMRMEVRGLGMLDIAELFGKNAVQQQGQCRLIVNLVEGFKLNNRLQPFEKSTLKGMENIPVLTLDACQVATLPLYVETALKQLCQTGFNIDTSVNSKGNHL